MTDDPEHDRLGDGLKRLLLSNFVMMFFSRQVMSSSKETVKPGINLMIRPEDDDMDAARPRSSS